MANAMGFEFDYKTTEDVFDEIAAKIPEFSDMSYDTIGSCGLAVGQGEKVSA
jgi:predicted molibdopterin-dependent oxidoreductase YjgC